MKSQVSVFHSILFYFLSVLITLPSSGQVVINEIQLANLSTLHDEDSTFEDWVELYNIGSSPVNLSGYGLSDDSGDLFRFILPDVTIQANSHLIIIADGKEKINLGSHWATAVNADDVWKFQANPTVPSDTGWRNFGFDDSSWNSGTGGIGLGDGDDGTLIPACASVYLRRIFTITDTSKISEAVLNVDYDDGFVAYLNGVEIARINVGADNVRPLWNAEAVNSHEAVMYQGMDPDSFNLDFSKIKSTIRNGGNILAIEIHNSPATSTDMTGKAWLHFRIKDGTQMFGTVPLFFADGLPSKEYLHAGFKLNNDGETVYLTDSSGIIIDQQTTGFLDLDFSTGRNPDGSTTWCNFESPTPDAPNAGNCLSGQATVPVFSLQGGFYSGSQTLSLTTTFPGGEIHYTADGSVPELASPLYSSPLTIASSVTIRARVFSNTSLPGQTVTNTYFINVNCSLPVYSLTTDPDNLYDYNHGIFVDGPNAQTGSPHYGANYWQNWKKPISLEYFDQSKNRGFRVSAGMKVTGGWSRMYNQKSLEIDLDDKYGYGSIDYNLMPDKPWCNQWSNWMIHAMGNDRGKCHMRDAVMERIIDATHVDHVSFEPCLLYINGQNWGVYYTRDNDDYHFITHNYSYDKEEVDVLKESFYYPTMEVKQGSGDAFWYMYNYATTASAADSGYFETMNSLLDIENQVDYFIAETFFPNDDWMGTNNNNLKLWRPRKAGGRFRYLSYDLDFGYGLYGNVTSDILAVALNPSPHNYNADIFKSLVQNERYRNYFINRYADLMNTVFQPANVDSNIAHYRNLLVYDINKQFQKWGGGDSVTWQNKVTNMISFAHNRVAEARNIVQNNFGLNSQVTLTFNVSPAGAGRIQISTVSPAAYPWTGVYFNGNPVTITAIPNPGFTFDLWTSNVVFVINDTNQTTTKNFTANDNITAYFTGAPAVSQILISEINYNSDSAMESGDWVELLNAGSTEIDLSNWTLMDEQDNHRFLIPLHSVIPAGGYLVISEDTDAFHSRNPAVMNVVGEMSFNFGNGGDRVRLYDHNKNLAASVTYDDDSPWPSAADGGGYTLELLNPLGNPDDGNNWFAGCPEGSPGTNYTFVNPAVTVTGNTTFCEGYDVLLSLAPDSTFTYQWQKDLVDIPGADSSSLQAFEGGVFRAVISANGCTIISDSVTVVVNPATPAPITDTVVARCGAGNLNLYASSPDSVIWFDQPSGGMPVATGSSFVTPFLSQSESYYVMAGNTCPSERIKIEAVIATATADPVATDVSRCDAGSITLSAIDTAAIFWYDSPGGNLLHSGDSYTTPVLTATTTYYAQAGITCQSNYVAVLAIINQTSQGPLANDEARCGPGTLQLTASAASSIYWYDSTGASLLDSGVVFNTPTLSGTTSYWVRSGSECPSTFTEVKAIINGITEDPVAASAGSCGPGSVTLSATDTATISWYDMPGGNLLDTGTTFTTPFLNQTTAYYVQAGSICPSNLVAVDAVIATGTAPPEVTGGSNCGEGYVTLYATDTATIFWYDMPGGNLLATGTSFTTPLLFSSVTYFVQAGIACPSIFVSVEAVIHNASGDPVVSDVSRCGEGTLEISAVAPDTISWYDSPGGTLLHTGPLFTTPLLSSTTTFYVQAGTYCPGAVIPVDAIIFPVVTDPVVTSAERCGTGSMTLTASGTPPVNWYDSVGGNILATGYSFVTPPLSESANYYVQSGPLCPSNMVPVEAIIHPIHQDPVPSESGNCGPGFVNLTATDTGTVNWYDLPTGGTLLESGFSFTTPYLDSTTTYYLITGTICPSNPVPITAYIWQMPVINLGNDTVIYDGQVLTLDAGAGFSYYSWSTGSVSQSIDVTIAGTYYVSVYDSNQCSASDSIAVSLITGMGGIITGTGTGAFIYPNPARSYFIIQFPDHEEYSIKIYDSLGKLKKSLQDLKQSSLINTKDWSSGVYNIEISNKNERFFEKLMVD